MSLQHCPSSLISDIFTNTLASKVSSFKGIPLLKEISQLSAQIFREDERFAQDRNAFGADKQELLLRCALSQNFEGVKEFSEEFYALLAVASKYQSLVRGLIYEAVKRGDSGFNDFDAKIIEYSCTFGNLWDEWYVHWLQRVQGNTTAERLDKMLKDGETIASEFYNHYTIIAFDNDGKMTHEPYYTAFKEQLTPIVSTMKELASELKSLADSNVESQVKYAEYFEQYATALSETTIDNLQNQWNKLDIIWMHIRAPLQITHDSETGYGDSLRTKLIPDYSLRFVDPHYQKENDFMTLTVQKVMEDYFAQRNTKLGEQGVFALQNSFCGVNCIPFANACSLHFRFSGQALPNDHEIRSEYGVKLFFDPVSTAARQVQTAKLVEKVMHDVDRLTGTLDPIDTITLHVTEHEMGHSAYGLDSCKDVISVPTKTLLEEPRAELTALSMMLVLFEQGKISEERLESTLASFAMQDLRRFAMYDSSALRPYTISATNCFSTYEKLGYMKLEGDRIRVDFSKTKDVLRTLKALFERILDAEDKRDGETLEQILKDMQVEGPMVKFLIEKLFVKK